MYTSQGIGLILAAVYTISVAQEIRILPTGDTQTKALGESVLFTCVAQGLENSQVDPNLKWFNKEDVEITDTTGRIYLESAGLQSLKLYVTGIENEDAGTYTCRGELDGNPQEEKVTLDIFKDITFDHAPSPQSLRIYTDALIECYVSGQPKPVVSWRYNGNTITTGGRYIQENEGLRILNITKEDGAFDYLCRAEVESDGRFDQRTIRVNVNTPPSIDQPVETQEGVEGQQMSLQCKATGDPAPKYKFYKDGNENPVADDGDRIEVDRDSGAINFRPLIKADEGEYMCQAINNVGTAEDTGTLRVLVTPKIETLLNQTAEEGQSQTLTCIASGDPAPTMTFRKVGNSYDYELGDNEGGKVVLSNPEAGRLEMEVKNLSPDDTDNYTCIATNTAGDHKQNGTLIVHYKPRFGDNHPTEFYLWAGKTRNITCMSQAAPEPHIKWMKDGKDLVTNETYRIYDMGKNSNLQITCREEDQGWIYGFYTCSASNNIGTGDIEIDVKRATVPGSPASASVREESPTMLLIDVAPPEDDGGIPVTGFRIEYEASMREVVLGDPIKIENLSPGTLYLFNIRARNEVGSGIAYELTHTTPKIRAPYALVLKNIPAEYPYEYNLQWEKPRTGGLSIDQYEFKIRKVTVTQGGAVDKPLEEWVRKEREDSPEQPMLSFMFKNLSPETNYEVQARARNDIGWSEYNTEFVFKTLEDPEAVAKGDEPGASVKPGGLETGAVIGIVIVIFLLFLIIVDVACYFMNGCGVLMCICVNLCGKMQPVNKEKAMEEGESLNKDAKKAPVEDAIVAQEQEVVTETPEKEQQATPPTPEVEEDSISTKSKNRKSKTLSQGNERWADVVQELERELSEKKPLSEDGAPMEELEPEDKEEKPDVIEDQVKENPPEEAKEAEEEVEVEPDEKTPLKEDPKC